jgi:quinol monooxygenase YgiN
VLHRDPDSPCRLMLYETWESPDDASAEQIHRPYRRAYHEALADLLARPREVTQWHTLRADRRDARLESRLAEELAEARA